ncbi:uncharacterized protein [Chironomus tepperi]|uniref:uncharacterized protein n=1 Tax=Chironomus tepperi TaxID=113505 RepID=UPI00391F0307
MQAETSMDTLVDLDSISQSKSKSSSNNSDTTDEISIQNEPQPAPKPKPKQPEQQLITSNYTFSTLALICIAIAMSTVVLMSPSTPKKKIASFIDLEALTDDDSDDLPTTKGTTESYGDVNASYINPEQAKFEFIHGQLKDLSICLILFNISDLNGACLVHNPKNFIDASEACTSHNMTLLEINSDHEKTRIYDETEKIFGTGGGTRIWMNGKYSLTEDAFLSHPKNVKFFITNDQIEERYGRKFTNDECLAIESYYVGRYHISAVPCGGAHYFYCEF